MCARKEYKMNHETLFPNTVGATSPNLPNNTLLFILTVYSDEQHIEAETYEEHNRCGKCCLTGLEGSKTVRELISKKYKKEKVK